jgi:hypothetical protein
MCHSKTFVCGHQLPPKKDASLQCGCGYVRVMNFPVQVLKCNSQWSTYSFRGGLHKSLSVNARCQSLTAILNDRHVDQLESVSFPNAHSRCPFVLICILILQTHTHKQTCIAFPIPAYLVMVLSRQQVHHVSQSPRPTGIIKCESRPFIDLFSHDSHSVPDWGGLVKSFCTLRVATQVPSDCLLSPYSTQSCSPDAIDT